MNYLFKTYILLFLNILIADTTVTVFDNVHHFFGSTENKRVIIENIQLPISNEDYSEIIMNVSLECPNGGCDPWDRKANISVKQFDQWIEIGRYVTPYGIGCSWSYDVTDYRSILKDSLKIKSYIDTWVDPGWLVTIEFTFNTGTPFTPNTSVRNIWNSDYIVYGDPSNPPNIPTVNEYIPSDAQYVKLRITTTGHGQGNTDNAAEFSYRNHQIIINDENTFSHDFWRDDCEFNECSPQFGTWQYDRSGFCPGDKVISQDFNLSNYYSLGQVLSLDYVLDEYFNECSPNNSNCINGQTCSDCNYNYNGHTEPFYFISSHLIIYSDHYHSNADSYIFLKEQNSSVDELQVVFENYVPVYGVQFSIRTDLLEGINNSNIEFISAEGGRAEDFGWSFSMNENGMLIGLAQYLGNPLPPGEGILTNIYWNGNQIENISGQIEVSNVEISGNFGSELSYEIGAPISFESNLQINSKSNLANNYNLNDPYPNPFNPVIQIEFQIFETDRVSLFIYNLKGKLIDTLVKDDKYDPGFHRLQWSGINKPSGVYFITMKNSSSKIIKKVLLLK